MTDENNITTTNAVFDTFIIRLEANINTDNNGVKFWYARELQGILEYGEWRNFAKIIDKAKIACAHIGQQVDSHFVDVNKMVESGVATKEMSDYKLTRYACYLIAQNADARKKIVAFAQTYFAVQTRRQELQDIELSKLNEDERRLQLRGDIKKQNAELACLAKSAGVIQPYDYAVFQNEGYKGLYGGLTENAILKRKGLTPKKDKILDHMDSEELGANIFRITQASAKMKRESAQSKNDANRIHHEAGKIARKAIEEMGNIMPENLPSPQKSIKQIEKEHKKSLKQTK